MAFVLSSISGNLISAASAGYAPTNSADVSAIASAYQVVSSIGVAEGALSSINGYGLSAGLANSARTATVWLGASGKLDNSAANDFYTTGNESGFVDSAYVDSQVSGKLDSTAFNSGDFYSTANESGFVDSSYVDSAVSGKQDAITFGYDANNKISSIDGSALAGEGGGGGSTVSTGEFLGYTVVSADNGVSILGNSSVVSSSVHIPYTNTVWQSNTISANGNASRFAIYNFNKTAGNMPSLPTGHSVRVLVTARCNYQNVYSDDQIHLIMYTGTNSGSPVGNWQVQNVQGYQSAIWDKTVTWNSTNEPKFLITAENYNTYTFTTTAKYSAAGVGESSQESSYTADILAASPSYVSSMVSGKADSSALSSYALSADVSGTVDLVSTQSANWGGSALALSAGPGVKLEKSGNVLVASTDETVLWSGTPITVAAASTGLPLTESPYNFERVALYWVPWGYADINSTQKQEAVAEARITSAIPRIGSVTEWNAEDSNTVFMFVLNAYFDSSKFYTQAIRYFALGDWTINIQGDGSYITKIVGINRTAEA